MVLASKILYFQIALRKSAISTEMSHHLFLFLWSAKSIFILLGGCFHYCTERLFSILFRPVPIFFPLYFSIMNTREKSLQVILCGPDIFTFFFSNLFCNSILNSPHY